MIKKAKVFCLVTLKFTITSWIFQHCTQQKKKERKKEKDTLENHSYDVINRFQPIVSK